MIVALASTPVEGCECRPRVFEADHQHQSPLRTTATMLTAATARR
jgi:hypothetical protein